MAYDSVWVLTSKSLETMFEEGGSGNWRASGESLRRARYIVAIRNRHSNWSQGEEQHGTAFLVGRVSGVAPSPPSEPNRLVVQFDKYARVHVPNAWPHGFRNPVTYGSLAELGISPDELAWQDFPLPQNEETDQLSQEISEIVAQAKEMIAARLLIQPANIGITITL